MIGSSENRISYNGNGIATEFAYTFKILEKSDIKVLHVAADGTETLLTKDYYVDRDKSVVLYPGYAPGEEIPEQNRPPILSKGEMLVLYREVPITQESALDKHWPFNVIENGLDKLTIICQQIWDRLQRSFYVSESTSSNFDPKVPIEAGKTFRVKDDGTGFEVTEDPARVLLLAQDVYEQTKERAEFVKDKAGDSIKYAVIAENAASAAKHYSENVNVFLPSVSDSGVLSWTNKAGLANPASVNIKGAKGDKGATGDKGNKGDKGDKGTAATITVGRVTTGAAGSSASVVNRGDANNALLDFVLPRGATGDTGDKGDKGDAGTAATITVGKVTTGAAGSSASVVNRGDANNAILDFVLPKGADGKGAVITVNGKEPDAAGNVNVDNTTYSAGAGLSLSSTTFANTAPVYFVTGTQTAATNVWTGDLPSGVTEYTNGLTINYYLPYAGKSPGGTLNLGGLGAKKIYQGNNNSNVSTQFPAGSVIQLVYIASLDNNAGGWKAIAYYYKDTTNTAGAKNTDSKIFLVGATSQATATATYSHDTVYVGTDGCLYSNNTKVSVEGHTHSNYVSTSDVAAIAQGLTEVEVRTSTVEAIADENNVSIEKIKANLGTMYSARETKAYSYHQYITYCDITILEDGIYLLNGIADISIPLDGNIANLKLMEKTRNYVLTKDIRTTGASGGGLCISTIARLDKDDVVCLSSYGYSDKSYSAEGSLTILKLAD